MSTLELKEAKLETDGRKLRANNSRQKIVDAMLSLVWVGDIAPSAENVATTANVGLRTVFRRFTDMEVLYREMIIEVEKKISSEVFIPFSTDQWQQQLIEFMDRKADIYEKTMPYRVAANFHKHHSTFMKENLIKWNEFERKILVKIVPAKVVEDITLFNALELTLSFDSWLQLRLDQGLTPKQAADTRQKMVNALLTDFN